MKLPGFCLHCDSREEYPGQFSVGGGICDECYSINPINPEDGSEAYEHADPLDDYGSDSADVDSEAYEHADPLDDHGSDSADYY